MAKIYTRTGDAGTTSVGFGERVPKDDPRVEAYGTLDEANALLGLLRARLQAEAAARGGAAAGGFLAEAARALETIQNDLFNVGFDWAWNRGEPAIRDEHVERLEGWIDAWDPSPLREFVLPGGSEPAAWAHLARTLVRRAERRAVGLQRSTPLNPASLRYVNRLSDLLFVLARRLNAELGVAETEIRRYVPRARRPSARRGGSAGVPGGGRE